LQVEFSMPPPILTLPPLQHSRADNDGFPEYRRRRSYPQPLADPGERL
jgi:hypothetical protein